MGVIHEASVVTSEPIRDAVLHLSSGRLETPSGVVSGASLAVTSELPPVQLEHLL